MKSYSEKLRHPKWQLKRLEVLKEYNATCCKCGDQETELHVHHLSYSANKEPWEYDLSNFKVVCKYCHHLIESLIKAIKSINFDDVTIIKEKFSQDSTILFLSYRNDKYMIIYHGEGTDNMGFFLENERIERIVKFLR